MAVGDLSADEQRFVTLVTSSIGLDRSVVVAWLGCESGWGVTKGDHNYLNVGPGRSYASVDQAAADTVATVATMGIGGASAAEQLASITGSDWNPDHYANGCLAQVYNELTGTPITATKVSAVGDALNKAGDFARNPAGAALGTIGDIFGGVIDSTVGKVAKASVDAAGRILLTITLTALFVVGGLGLIFLGLSRITDVNLAGTARNAAQLATVAAAA